MKKLFYSKEINDFKVECFKDGSIDELTGNAYEIRSTNLTTKQSDFVTTNTPQGAIALADMVFNDVCNA